MLVSVWPDFVVQMMKSSPDSTMLLNLAVALRKAASAEIRCSISSVSCSLASSANSARMRSCIKTWRSVTSLKLT